MFYIGTLVQIIDNRGKQFNRCGFIDSIDGYFFKIELMNGKYTIVTKDEIILF